MSGRKIILNIFVFSILIGGFFYYYINSNTVARAGELRLCVKGAIKTDPVTGSADYSGLDFTNYLTIEYPEYSCPTGYAMMPAGFNLNLLQYPTSTNLLGGGNNPNGGGATSSTSTGGGQNTPNSPNNPYSDLLDQLNGNNNNNSGNNSNGSTNSGDGSNNTGSGSNNGNGTNNSNGSDGLAGQLGNVAGQNPNYTDPNYTNPNYTDPNYTNPNYTDPNYTNPNYTNPNGSNNNGTNPYKVNPNPVIQVDPTLATGRFETLDPADYKYCVLLTRDMSTGATDNATGREVSALQMYLYDRGYMDTPANGNYDQNTALGVARFQYRNQIEVSGIVKADLRSVLKELTCIKYPVVSYVSKPVSPTPVTVKVSTGTGSSNSNTTPKTTTPPKVTTPSKPTTVIPPTNTEPAPVTSPTTGTLSSVEGNMYLSKGNILYFTYNTKSVRPFICLSLNNTDCTDSTNYAPVTEGIMLNLYEVVNLSNFWAFSLYNSQIWGTAGDKTRIYLKDSQNAKDYSIYIVNILN